MKIAVVGGGSTYSPEFVDGLIPKAEALGLTEVVLTDIDGERLATVGGFCERMVAARGGAFAMRHTTDRKAAIEGADFVVLQIRVGGQEARHQDIVRGLGEGVIGQETTGEGGFAKALRTIPVALEIAAEIKALAPNATLLNFTNPAGLVSEALVRHGGLPVIGLCNVPIGMHMDIAEALEVPAERIEIDYVGLNHLGWVTGVRLDGDDITERVLSAILPGGVASNVPELDYPEGFLQALGAVPSSYLRYFYATGEMMKTLEAQEKTRAEEVMEIEERLLAWYADPAKSDKPPALEERGGAWYSRLAVRVIEGLQSEPADDGHVEGGGHVEIVNVPNRGAVPGFSDDTVLEIPARLDQDGAHALPQGPVPSQFAGLMHAVKAYEELAVAAAVEQDRSKALLALVANPLVGQADKAARLLDEIWPA